MADKRTYGGIPAEDRRRQRREHLLEVALCTLGKDGIEGLAVSRLCRDAGLNDRYFYESFADCDEVLSAVFDRIAEEIITSIRARVTGHAGGLEDSVRVGIAAVVDYFLEHPDRAHIALSDAVISRVSPVQRSRLRDAYVSLAIEHAQRHFGAAEVARVGDLARFVGMYSYGGFSMTLMRWLNGELAVDRDTYIEQTANLFIACIEQVFRPQKR